MRWTAKTRPLSYGSRIPVKVASFLICRRVRLQKRKSVANYVQAKKLVGVVPVFLKPRHWKTLADTADDVSSVVDSSAGFSDPASDVPIFGDEIFRKDARGYLTGLTSKDNCAPSHLQCIPELCQTYRFSVPSGTQSVHYVIKDALPALGFVGGGETSLADLNESHAAEKADLKRSFAVSKEKLADA